MTRMLLLSGFLLVLPLSAPAQDASAQKVEVGKSAPDITLTGIDGKTFKLSERTATGKNVALMFDRAHW